MDKLVKIVFGASSSRTGNDDDFADRLSSRYTVVLLVIFAILVGLNQYVRNPITCWTPVHFERSHAKFATNYCWVKNTYYLPWHKEVPKEGEDRQMITYYQWIPFILLGQALLFYGPTMIWRGLNSKAGIDADNILSAAHTFSKTNMVETRDRTMTMLTSQMDRFLCSRKSSRWSCDIKSLLSSTLCRLCGKRLGNYLVVLFLFSKICYIANVIGQLFLLNVVLSTKYTTFGIDIVREMAANRDWSEDAYVAFPRVTLCDFKIRGQDMANVHAYTIQCVLPINLYNEKIYVFLWYWMILVTVISCLSFVVWFLRAVIRSDRISFVTNHLKLGGVLQNDNIQSDLVHKFTTKYLRQDGVFLLRLIAHNTNNITTTEIICSLWSVFREQQPGYPGQTGEDLLRDAVKRNKEREAENGEIEIENSDEMKEK